MPTVIGISGKIGSGKTTLANMITEIDPRFEVVHFADALKHATAAILGMPVKCMYEQSRKNDEVPWGDGKTTVGKFLQWFGTDIMRAQWDHVWVNALMNRLQPHSFWVIDDVRFLNEADAVRRWGYLIRLEGDPKEVRKNSTRNLDHPSETQLDNYGFDIYLDTERPIEQTRSDIIAILNEIL